MSRLSSASVKRVQCEPAISRDLGSTEVKASNLESADPNAISGGRISNIFLIITKYTARPEIDYLIYSPLFMITTVS